MSLRANLRVERHDIPLGENRTTFTAAECRLSVARYSTLGGLGVGASLLALALVVELELLATAVSTGIIFGWTIHTYSEFL